MKEVLECKYCKEFWKNCSCVGCTCHAMQEQKEWWEIKSKELERMEKIEDVENPHRVL